jgi:hypothetical protein
VYYQNVGGMRYTIGSFTGIEYGTIPESHKADEAEYAFLDRVSDSTTY